MYNLISFFGIFAMLLIAWLLSADRHNINWRVVFWAIVLQLIFACLVFWLPPGMWLFKIINAAVLKFFSFAKEGMYFLFGPLAVSPGETGPNGEQSIGFILTLQVLPAVIFFSSLMALLYYLGIMPKVVRGFQVIFTKLMRTSGAESLYAASSIFVGIESAFTIRPFLKKMTKSELCTILTAGMATIASTVLAFYAGILKNVFPAIAGHLVSASILSAPAAIVMSKLIYPEDGSPVTLGQAVSGEYKRASSWMESIINGAFEGIKLIVGIVALLLAFLGLLAMVNWGFSVLGQGIGRLFGLPLDLSLEKILGFFFYPLALLIGVPPADVPEVAQLLGQRMIVTELVSYQQLAQFIQLGVLIHPRSIVITTYALCGFAHIASLAIFIGGITALAPERARDLAKLGFRSLIAATLACLMTGAVAGVFFTGKGTILLN
jgi:CNT family concentrative nucleoside transporter